MVFKSRLQKSRLFLLASVIFVAMLVKKYTCFRLEIESMKVKICSVFVRRL